MEHRGCKFLLNAKKHLESWDLRVHQIARCQKIGFKEKKKLISKYSENSLELDFNYLDFTHVQCFCLYNFLQYFILELSPVILSVFLSVIISKTDIISITHFQ